MSLISLDLPAGVYRNGTDLQSSGRWRDSNLVRWHDNTLRPIGGWRTRSDTASAGKIRGLHAWIDNSSDRWITAGSYNKLYVYNSAGTQYDITPTGLTVGNENALNPIGYGNSFYGQEDYGIARQEASTITPATTWAIDSWGENMVGCSSSDGKIYEWQLNTATIAAPVTNAPVGCRSLLVTEERFLMALGAAGNPRIVQWSDREDNTQWTPAATNEAGSLELQTNGRIQCGVRVQNQSLILTDTDAHVATYSGPPYVYGIERVGTSCGIVSTQAIAVVDIGAIWMGSRTFYAYSGGAVSEVHCDVADYVFSDINLSQISKVCAVANANFGEIWWFYPSESSNENDRYVVFNYNDSTWAIGEIARTSGVDSGVYRQPIIASALNNKLYEHEIGFNYDGGEPFAESGPISIGDGENVMSVTKMIPDEKTQGDVDATFKSRFYPNDVERTYGPYNMSNPTSLRFTGRQVRMRIEGVNADDWRVGINRLEVVAGGRR
mgnify:CR=1 FL=1|jgi:hypothetical protein|tara:strand:+ start:222 stop:1703 length:1482 start_codon:yes stop_codon:yes gene_type:complete